jgi:O-antigen ligase
MFSFLKPAGFEAHALYSINSFFNYARIFFAILIVMKYFRIYNKLSKLIVAELAFFSILLISTIYNNSDLSPFFVFSISILTFSMLVEIYVTINIRTFIDALFVNHFIIIVGNLLLICIIYGFSINPNIEAGELSFISSSNMTATFIFPALCSAFLYSNYQGQKYNILAIIMYISTVLTVLMLWSATSVIGVILLLTYIFIIHKSKAEKYINCKILHILAIIIIIGFTTGIMQKYFSYIIEDILHKDLTMTGRTKFWITYIKIFLENPLLGKGHNVIIIDNGVIQILYRGGFLGFIFLIHTYMTGTKRLFNENTNRSMEKFFIVVLITILIMSISESWFYFFGFYIILIITYNLPFFNIQDMHNYAKTNRLY